MKYADRITYGNIAYDLGRVRPEYEVPQRERIQKQREEAAVEAKSVSRARAQEKQGISLFSVVGFVVIAIMMVFIVLGNLQLTEISYSMKETRARIAELEMEREQLEVKYETAFNLNELRTYAIDTLGMTEATVTQTISLGNVKEDKAVILDNGAASESMISKVSSFLTSLLEYFR